MPEAIGGQVPEWIVDIRRLVELRLASALTHQRKVTFFKPFVQRKAVVDEHTRLNTINECQHKDRLGHDDLATDLRLADGHELVRVMREALSVVEVFESVVHVQLLVGLIIALHESLNDFNAQ